MNTIKLLDVTLRDGGYKTNFYFTEEVIVQTLTLLDEANIDYIEVGYRNGSFRPIANIGPAGLCTRDYLNLCRKNIHHAKLTAICHPANIKADDFAEMQDCGLDSVRICFPMHHHALGFKTLDMINKYSFDIFINFTRVSHYPREVLVKLLEDLSGYQPKGFYLADSNGSLIPQDVITLVTQLQEKTSIPLGFHPHDNLFLAQGNAIAALTGGVQYIDASLYGLGKGAGNLRTEGIVSYLRSQGINRYDLCKLLDAAEFIKMKVCDMENDLAKKDIIMGVFDLSQEDALHLGTFSNAREYYHRAEHYRNIKTS